MLRIRLSRTGKKRQPSYRVVVAEIEAKRDGRVVERIGHYNPLVNPPEYRVDEDRALYWLSVGAQPSDAVRVLLNKQGTFGRLARLHAGESREALVAEFQGTPVAETPAAAAEGATTLVDRVTSAAGAAVGAVAAPVAAAVETVGDAAGAVVQAVATPVAAAVERLEEAVAAVLGRDEEE